MLGDAGQIGPLPCGGVGIRGVALPRRDGVSGVEDAEYLSLVFLRSVSGTADTRVDARGAMFRECVAAFPFVGDATPDFRDDSFRFGLRAQQHLAVVHWVADFAGTG